MRALEIAIDGKKLCLVGIGHEGVLTAIVNSVVGDRGEDLFLQVGGLISETDEHHSADKPKKKYRIDAGERLRPQKRYPHGSKAAWVENPNVIFNPNLLELFSCFTRFSPSEAAQSSAPAVTGPLVVGIS